jgi:hypothetical protein
MLSKIEINQKKIWQHYFLSIASYSLIIFVMLSKIIESYSEIFQVLGASFVLSFPFGIAALITQAYENLH